MIWLNRFNGLMRV